MSRIASISTDARGGCLMVRILFAKPFLPCQLQSGAQYRFLQGVTQV
jgi:hypothetical protein